LALADQIPFGISLPHRSPDPIDIETVRAVAQRADSLGFQDLWVTENTLDHVTCFDPIAILTYAAAVTQKIRLGASVVVLPVQNPLMVAHQWATLDFASGGRAILGVGQGREEHFRQFQVPMAGRVTRMREQIELIRALWTKQKVTYQGRFYQVTDASMSPKPVQKPTLPIWMGVGHPDAIRRAATLSDGWMGAGGSTVADFQRAVPLLRDALQKAGRDPKTFPVSKRIFMSVHERPEVARAELHRWYSEVYFNPEGTETSGLYGTPDQVKARLEEIVAMGANHLLLNPVTRYAEQVETLARIVGLA
jgi:probable F420-dependent oxidoreductase